MIIAKFLNAFGRYLMLMGRTFSRPERMRMFLKQYIKEMVQLGVDSIGIVLLIVQKEKNVRIYTKLGSKG